MKRQCAAIVLIVPTCVMLLWACAQSELGATPPQIATKPAPEVAPEPVPEVATETATDTAPEIASAPTVSTDATSRPSDDARAAPRKDLVVGDVAPDFTLSETTGENPVTLHALRGRPTIVIFGSCTCPPFVRSTRATGALFERYRDRVNFLMVYGREAHPTDGWVLDHNRFSVKQATTMDERRAAARAFGKDIGIQMRLVVDTMDGDAERLYGCFPNRLVVIDAEGRIAHIGARGPQSTLNSAREVPAVLERLLGQP